MGHYGVEICCDVRTKADMRKILVSTVGLHGKKTTDEVVLDDFLPTLARRSRFPNPYPPRGNQLTAPDSHPAAQHPVQRVEPGHRRGPRLVPYQDPAGT